MIPSAVDLAPQWERFGPASHRGDEGVWCPWQAGSVCELVIGNFLWSGYLWFPQSLCEYSDLVVSVIVVSEDHWSHCLFNGRDLRRALSSYSGPHVQETIRSELLTLFFLSALSFFECQRYAAVRWLMIITSQSIARTPDCSQFHLKSSAHGPIRSFGRTWQITLVNWSSKCQKLEDWW